MTIATEPTTTIDEQALFVTERRFGESLFREIKWCIMPPFAKSRCVGMFLIMETLALWLFWGRPLGFAIATVVYAAAALAAYVLLAYRTERINIARFRETYPSGEVLLRVSCLEHEIRSENLSDGGAKRLAYKHVVCAGETERYLVLMTKANQYVFFFKEGLSEAELKNLRDFLAAKCPRVRFKAWKPKVNYEV